MNAARTDTMTFSEALEAVHTPETSADALRRLARFDHESVREAVARHPNTPPEVLFDLAGDFPSAFFENPVLDLLFLEDPSLVERLTEGVLEAEAAPEKWIRRASRSANARVQTAVAGHPRLPSDVLNRLLWDESARVCIITIDSQSALAEEVLEELAEDPSEGVRAAVARHENTPDAVVEQLAEDEKADVRLAVSKRPAPSSVMIHFFEDDDPRVRSTAVTHSDLPSGVLETLSEDPDHRVRKAVVEDENTPDEVLDRLAGDHHEDVRDAFLPGRFSEFSVSSLRMRRMIRAGEQNRRLCYRAAEETDTPADVLELLANHQDESVRQKLAVHPRLPDAAARRLARAESGVVRQAVEASRTLSVQALVPVYENLNEKLREAVTVDSSTPLDMLYRIAATDPDPYLRWLAVRNPRVTPEDLARLSARPNSTVRREVAACPDAPAEAMRSMFGDPDPEVRERVARHANTPQGLLGYLRRDRHPDVRLRAKLTLRMREPS